MGAYLLAGLNPEAPLEASRLRMMRDAAIRAGFEVRDLSEQTWIASWGPDPVATVTVGPWILLGEAFHRHHAPVWRVSADDPLAYEKKLLARFWGRYIGLRLDRDGRLAALLRDPSGALDCIYWRDGPLTVVASDLPEGLRSLVPETWRLDPARVEAALHDPYSTAGALLLTGPTALDAGTMVTLAGGELATLWRPDAILRGATPVDDVTAAETLRQAVDEAVDAVAGQGHALAVEISGGLDSGIVAATANRHHPGRARLWLNAWGPDASADERPWVDLLADHLGIPATCVPRATGQVTRDLLETMPHGLRPALAALDGLHDADWARRFRAAGIDRVLTGKGGDGLFIQPADVGVFVDLWHERGWRALLSPALVNLARWNERSVWSLIAKARRHNWTPETPDPPNLLLAPPIQEPLPRHPWLEGIGDLGPIKRRQISALVQGLGLHGPTLQTKAAAIIHPLLSQPVTEACLALPISQLTLGRRDRGLAREAFCDRLPPALLERRSKGEMTAFYGHMIADGLDVLRPWLLDGQLAAMGLIDRPATEALLTRESLAWRGGYVDIMVTAAIEGWVRAWVPRLSSH
ncbi:asparagine synthase-related protein [Brevundimonas sp.]